MEQFRNNAERCRASVPLRQGTRRFGFRLDLGGNSTYSHFEYTPITGLSIP